MKNHIQKNEAGLTVGLVRKHDRPGPRYTSYPTANEFSNAFKEEDYRAHLAEANRAPDEPLSLYVHIPFCRKRCSFCACNVIITRDDEKIERYLDTLTREIELVAEALPDRRNIIQYHWGGGTPTHLSTAQMRRLQKAVTDHFHILPDAEAAIEINPVVTTREQLDLLREMGFNRLSMGIQDFDPLVQERINRHQDETATRKQFDYARQAGFESINVDLVYGLPGQSIESFTRTIETIIEMRPERIACYSYAFVPWIKPHQNAITKDMLPEPDLKIELFLTARSMFLEAGYDAIGMDHFAVPNDELAQAAANSVLHRNFMGYTTHAASDMIAFGVSGISDVRSAYAQNTKDLDTYHGAVDDGRLPVERGAVLSRDDEIRRFTITRLMCNMRIDTKSVEERFGIVFSEFFADELAALRADDGPMQHGFLEISDSALIVTPVGRFFVRNVALHFDTYLRRKHTDKPVFSRTV